MSKYDKLDIINLPLDKKLLIEASAGTGKTFTIGLITIRLLLKDINPLSIDKIILITFTEAATAELRKKTAEKINEAFLMWENEDYRENDDLSIIIKSSKSSKDAARKRANLQDAIARIDEMPVFTIHGFCTRLLNEFAFETKNFEKKEVEPNLSYLEDRVIIDFWKEEIEKLDDITVKYLPSKFSPEVLKTGLNKVKNFPDAEITCGEKEADTDIKKEIIQLEENIGLSKEKYLNLKEKIDEFSVNNNENIKYNKEINGICRIHAGFAKKNKLFSEYNESIDTYFNYLGDKDNMGGIIISLLQYKLAKKFLLELQAEKEKQKVIGFNDLIQNTYNAVINDDDKILFNAVQKRYEAILVDEFQDTDKMQYKIFSDLFNKKPFFMIGDPKQAIYRFRGGDIYAYIEAKSGLKESVKTMDKNFRSQEKLINALNSIYKIENPFENKNINYIEVIHGKNLLPLKINGKEQKPFILQNFEYSNKDDFYLIKEGIVNEIKCLLYNTDTQIYDNDSKEYKRICAKDIAILTRTNDQAREYRDALRESSKRIPAVIRRSSSVFTSDAAAFLMRLLNGFIHSQKESAVKAALMEFRTITQDDIKPFTDAYDNWKKHGIMNALDKYFNDENIWSKIYSEDNAERNTTNIRQLIELLDKEEKVTGRMPDKLFKRFGELVNEDNEESEERLETDDDAVQIMTIHTSKGLQFPVVFIPDITLANERPGLNMFEKEPPVFHKEKNINIEYEISNRKTDGDNAKSKENQEIIEESARNFYVAVTRAIYRIYTVNAWKNNEKYIFSAGQKICKNIRENENIEVVSDLKNLWYHKSSKKIQETFANINKEIKYLPKRIPFEIQPSWNRTSFSDIAKKLMHADHKEIKKKEIKTEEPSGGIRMGLLLHSIFEKINFNIDKNELSLFIDKKLSGFKEFSGESGEAKKTWIKEKVRIILNKNLDNIGKLCEIKDEQKKAELNFFISSQGLCLNKIKEIMGDKINEFASYDLMAKYLKGAIDLVFTGKDGRYYILDWKSNYLEKYSKDDDIDRDAMIPHGYHLQYYIYTVALKRWLEVTHNNIDFRKIFGGVYYIFIRGVTEGNNSDGIYFKKGDEIIEDIIKLDDCLRGKSK